MASVMNFASEFPPKEINIPPFLERKEGGGPTPAPIKENENPRTFRVSFTLCKDNLVMVDRARGK